jgi:hypothetical protein
MYSAIVQDSIHPHVQIIQFMTQYLQMNKMKNPANKTIQTGAKIAPLIWSLSSYTAATPRISERTFSPGANSSRTKTSLHHEQAQNSMGFA